MSEEQKSQSARIPFTPDAPYCIPDANGRCVTCSDEALPATVLSVDAESGIAFVRIEDTTEEIDITLVAEVVPGDILLVHGGVAISAATDYDN